MSGLLRFFRALGVLLVGLGAWGTGSPVASAASVEYLMVPSAAMGRNIPVAFQGGGPHAVVLLDAFNAAPDVSNWVTAGNAMNTFAGKGVSVAAPAGGAYSMYTDWELDGSKQWATFLGDELPNWLEANKGLAPSGHAIVGASQGGYGALAMAADRPDRYRYAGSMSGFLYPSRTQMNGVISNGINASGANVDAMWGAPQLGRWKWHDPLVHMNLLIDAETRMWVFSPQTLTCSDPAAMIGACAEAAGSNRTFYEYFRTNFGKNGHFDFPVDGNHDWGNWAAQLVAMSNDVAKTIK